MSVHSASGRGLGKAILSGEHFVLDGATAVAIALPSFRTEVYLELDPHQGSLVLQAPEAELGERDRAQAVAMLQRALTLAGVTGGGRAKITSTVPLRRGFGSSAALAVAAVEAAWTMSGRGPPPVESWLDQARTIEALVHGTSSGLDPAAAMGHGAVAFRDGRLLRTVSPPNNGAWARARWVLIDLGPGPATVEVIERANRARAAMAEGALADLVARADATARAAIAALDAGDVQGVAGAMATNARCLEEIDVVNPAMRAGISAAVTAGALAAKQTGAGLGGALLALAPNAETADTVVQRLTGSVAATWIVETVA